MDIIPPDSQKNDYYKKPSLAVWAATISAMAAIFMFGGFIKLQQTFEKSQQDLKKELKILKKELDLLKKDINTSNNALIVTEKDYSIIGNTLNQDAPNNQDTINKVNNFTSHQLPQPNPPAILPNINPEFLVPQTPITTKNSNNESILITSKDSYYITFITSTPNQVAISAGSNSGIKVGEELNFLRHGAWQGKLNVIKIFQNFSICEVINSNSLPEVGDIIYPIIIK